MTGNSHLEKGGNSKGQIKVKVTVVAGRFLTSFKQV